MNRIMLTLLSAFVVFGTAAGQDQQDQQNQMGGQDFDIERVQPIGNVETGQRAFETDQDRGAIVLTHSTPDEQHANFDVVGPDGYYEHFDFEDAAEGERVLENLMPGVYSIAASDEGLGLAHTIVEVRAGEATEVHVSLEPWNAATGQGQNAEGQDAQDQNAESQDAQDQNAESQDAQGQNAESQDAQGQQNAEGETTYDPATTYGTYEGFGEDAQPGFPYGAFTVGTEANDATPEAGAIAVDGMENDARLVVTGPNGYSEEVGNGDTLDQLPPGQYVLAASGSGTDTSVTTVQVQVGQILRVDPNFSEYSGGAQQQNGQQQNGQQQDGQQQDGQEQNGQEQDGN